MESLPTGCRDLDLRAVRVRPTRGAQEHRRWDRLVATHHYPMFDMWDRKLLQIKGRKSEF